jgi:hypothetical protein
MESCFTASVIFRTVIRVYCTYFCWDPFFWDVFLLGPEPKSRTPTCFPSLGRRRYIAALLLLIPSSLTPPPPASPTRACSSCVPPQPPAMACLTDLVNLDLSDTTEKIIAEYIWYGRVVLLDSACALRIFSPRQLGSILLGAARRLFMAFPRAKTGSSSPVSREK